MVKLVDKRWGSPAFDPNSCFIGCLGGVSGLPVSMYYEISTKKRALRYPPWKRKMRNFCCVFNVIDYRAQTARSPLLLLEYRV